MTYNAVNCSSTIQDLNGKIIVVNKGHHHPRIRLQLGDVLSQDTTGVVRCARDVKNPKSMYAVKCISLRNMTHSKLVCISNEIELHERCSAASDNVVQYHGVFRDHVNKMTYVATELLEGGNSLEYILKEERKRPCDNDKGQGELYIKARTDRIKKIFAQILDMADACHKIGIYHRDLNPENIFVKNDGRVVIGKFGRATTNKMSCDFHLGNRSYLSPEVYHGIRGDGYSPISSLQADVWALGVLFINLVNHCLPGDKPYVAEETFSEYVNSGNLSSCELPITRDADEILKSIFRTKPSERTSIATLRERMLMAETFEPGGCEDVTSAESHSGNVDYSASDVIRMETTTDGSNEGSIAELPLRADNGTSEDEDETDSHESDGESEGPITPETHAADVISQPIIVTDVGAENALENLDSITELNLSASSPVVRVGRAEQVQALLEFGHRKGFASPVTQVQRETPVLDDSWLRAKRVEKPYKEWNVDVIMRLYRAIKF